METMVVLRSKPKDANVRVPFGQFIILDQSTNRELSALILASCFGILAQGRMYFDPEFSDLGDRIHNGATIGGSHNPTGIIWLIDRPCIGA